MSTVEEFMDKGLGDFGYKQLIQALLVSLPLFFDAQQVFITVFTDKTPTWHCTTSSAICNTTSNICDLPKDSWAWDVPYHKTVVSDWDLLCSSSSFVIGLSTSAFFIGSLFGGIFMSPLADSVLGRKNMLLSSCFGMSVASLLTILSINVWIYSALRFISGFFRGSIFTASLVLVMETVGKQRRGQVALVGFLCFSIGTVSLPAIAYSIMDSNPSNSWRFLYFWTSIPAILYCIIANLFVRESPRWLYLQGRAPEAVAVLHKLNSSSSTTLHVPLIKEDPNENKCTSSADFGSSIRELLNRGWACQRLAKASTLAFGIGLVYYGIVFGVEAIDFNIYLSMALNGFTDIPAYFVSHILIERQSRKGSILAFCVLCGLSSIVMCFIVNANALDIAIELASLFSVCVAFNVMLIYSTEMFPTNVRNTASAMVRQAINLGAAVGPLLVSLGRINRFFSYGVLGVVVICSGLIVLQLPETRGMSFCDTLDEQEKNDLQQ